MSQVARGSGVLATCVRAMMCAVLAIGSSMPVTAAAPASEVAEWRRCAREASAVYEVPLVIMTLLYEMEGGRLGEETPNRDKEGNITSYDIGPMQINSQHLNKLKHYNITREMLRDSMRVNVDVAAWLLRDVVRRNGGVSAANAADVVAQYHSPTPEHQAKYIDRATRIIERRLTELRAARLQ